jgi:ankyrin repeat protein
MSIIFSVKDMCRVIPDRTNDVSRRQVESLSNLAERRLSLYLQEEAFRQDVPWIRLFVSRCKDCPSAEVMCQKTVFLLIDKFLSTEQTSPDVLHIIKVLLEECPPINTAAHEHQLIYAVNGRRLDIVELLLDHGWNVNYVHSNSTTALTAAAKVGDDAVRLLLDRGADPWASFDLATIWESTVATAVAFEAIRDRELVKLLAEKTLKRLTDVELRQVLVDTLLCLAASRNPAYVDALLEMGASPNACVEGPRGHADRPLIQAVAARCVDTCRVLINAGADVNVISRLGDTPLLIAATRQAYDVVKLLLTSSADVFYEDCRGETPLSSSLSSIYEGRPPLSVLLLLRCNSSSCGLGLKQYTHYGLCQFLQFTGIAAGLRLLMTASDFSCTDLEHFRKSFEDFLPVEFNSYLRQLDAAHQPLSLVDLSRQCFRQQVRRTRRNILQVLKLLSVPYGLFCRVLLGDIVIRDSTVGFDSDLEINALFSEMS